MTDLEKMYVVILCGGLGTRLRPIISDEPKVLAKIGNHTFLDVLINNISFYGAKNIILCTGYLKDRVKRHFDYYCNDHYNYNDYNVKFSEEDEQLGTGGALKNAILLIKSDPFIVMNGDSICNINFKEFLDFHISKKALLSMVLSKSTTSQDYGSVILDNSLRITSFDEKSVDNNKALINTGIYIMRKDIFCRMPDRKIFSLEYDLFPKLCNDYEGVCYGFITDSEVIDIGTPERYGRAIDILSINTNK